MHLKQHGVVKIICTFNNKKRCHKKLFSTKSCVALYEFHILQATQSWVQHVKADGNSHTRRLLNNDSHPTLCRKLWETNPKGNFIEQSKKCLVGTPDSLSTLCQG